MLPVPAAVVVLVREQGGVTEVYLVRRSERLAFLGGFWAFPGGRLEAEDTERQVTGASGERAARIAAAARELAEETGVELPLDASLFLDVGRTVTPDFVHLRFDATYFLVAAPPGADPSVACSGGELTDGAWIAPDVALAEWENGDRLVSPVVVEALRALGEGIPGIAGRLPDRLAKEAACRVWDIASAVSIAMLRTPTLPPATHTNCYLIGGLAQIIIDPASPFADEQAILDAVLDERRAAGRRIAEVWLTHHHGDHIGGAERLAARFGVRVAAHPQTAALLAGRLQVDRLLADGEVATLPAGGGFPERRLRVVATPGHAPGHVCAFEEQTRFVVTGDMVAGVGTIVVDPPEGDMSQYLASLARMQALGARALLPAHGPILADPNGTLEAYVRHRLWREALVASALAAHGVATPAELVPEVYADVPAALHALAERSLLAHLQKLVADGRARNEGGRFSSVSG